MTAYNVTFYLDDSQEEALQNLVTLAAATRWKLSNQSIFEMMMKSGFDFFAGKKDQFSEGKFIVIFGIKIVKMAFLLPLRSIVKISPFHFPPPHFRQPFSRLFESLFASHIHRHTQGDIKISCNPGGGKIFQYKSPW